MQESSPLQEFVLVNIVMACTCTMLPHSYTDKHLVSFAPCSAWEMSFLCTAGNIAPKCQSRELNDLSIYQVLKTTHMGGH